MYKVLNGTIKAGTSLAWTKRARMKEQNEKRPLGSQILLAGSRLGKLLS